MRIEHIIDSETKARLRVSEVSKGKVHPRRNKPRKRNQKPLSERELKELMGVHRDTYTRRNGAVRRK
ncbi:hypothetical protein [Ureibacillus sinduriensis]|uniref:Uncharacterized protein n=1 Tax=Ureibacillus sinduriensis BLB-1 = JCM 15800 TaxID=1384057 RepID=A0A0A3HUK9_9BACL|nr:hypothetical protein [Ureibacillus sinduriensis]KGR74885.1 hypothetical protein CD33_14100 [Ureibacillus sinduriensis BLB-1 = JCM 15800]